MRKYSITQINDEWYNAQCTDSYGKEYQNWFDTKKEASKWIVYVWKNEEWFNSTNSQELLANAIKECKEIDEKAGRRAIL